VEELQNSAEDAEGWTVVNKRRGEVRAEQQQGDAEGEKMVT
jgi:hypothetical protein